MMRIRARHTNHMGSVARVAAAFLAVATATAAIADTTFTYQGELKANGNVANGAFDMQFSLWNALNGGTQIGSTVTQNGVSVNDGRFTVELDFGFSAFDTGDRWLQIRVNATTLAPRQPINAAPFAIKTRGLFVNQDESFVGVGRSYKITAAEKFGVHMNTSGFGGMYIETGTDGEPFYGYSRNSSVDAYHYYDSASEQWRLWAGADRLVVDRSTGDIGIGTLDPTVPLHVEGNDPSAVILAINTNPSGNAITGINELSNNDNPAISGVNGGTAGVGVYGYCWSTTGLNYGVYGASNSTSGYDFFAGGAAANYGASSSIRWKQNVENIPQPLDKISQLRGVYFDWDEDHGGHHDVGMIAEEVGAVMPEIVVYEANGVDAQGMDYSKLTPLLIEAMNALREEKNAEIDALRAEKDTEISQLMKRLVALEERVAGTQ